MKHLKSSFCFESKDGEYRVDYVYREDKYMYMNLAVEVFLNDIKMYTWDEVPSVRTQNPSKTQAKEIIAKSRKEKNIRTFLK